MALDRTYWRNRIIKQDNALTEQTRRLNAKDQEERYKDGTDIRKCEWCERSATRENREIGWLCDQCADF